jgi:hypothetical protein
LKKKNEKNHIFFDFSEKIKILFLHREIKNILERAQKHLTSLRLQTMGINFCGFCSKFEANHFAKNVNTFFFLIVIDFKSVFDLY